MRKRALFAVLLCLGILLAAQFLVCTVEAATLYRAVVATAAADYSSGAHSIATVDPVDGKRKITNNLVPTISDISVAAFGRYFYRMERYNADSITKFDISKPSTPIWQFSTTGTGEVQSSNPYDMIFYSAKKAFVPRYGSTKAWIVNPSATKESKFKIGELNLSAYGDQDGLPEMNGGVIVGDKLFLVMQRLNENRSWNPDNIPYIAVFNAKTNKEINTGKGSDGLKGIPLPIRSPSAIVYLEENNTIYVQGCGGWEGSSDPDLVYTGGIVALNPETYEVKLVLDDGDTEKHPYGNITGLGIASKSLGYFVAYDGWGDNTLYRFNPTTGKTVKKLGSTFQHINIAGMSTALPVDKNGILWVCDQTHARLLLLKTKTNKAIGTLKTNLNPIQVIFMEVP